MAQPAPAPRQRYLDQLSTSLFHFILPLLPTPEELNTKQQVRVLIEKLIRTVEPKSRLLAFGSTANGFSLRNSDMDLCVLLDPSSTPLPASELVTLIGNLLERETNFAVKSLPKAYVPIIKLSLLPSPGLPFGIACDIGFENRLALENTRLLLTYATVDPARVRTMVLFVKVWSKRRRINSPYRGTLSSYGYTLLVLFFLIHVQQPSVLPNLQAIPPPPRSSATSPSPSAAVPGGGLPKPASHPGVPEHEVNGWDVWFFDDTELLRREWSSGNVQSVGELLIDFFRFYCQSFAFNTDVVSIRAGLVTKESKNWTTDSDVGGMNEMSRERNRLCIEDPFERSYNVARTVTKDGLFTIRGEFMRATRILTTRPERAVAALAQLCEERDEELMHAPRSRSPRPGGGRTPYPGGFRGGYSPPKNHYSLPTSSSSLHGGGGGVGGGGGLSGGGGGLGSGPQHGSAGGAAQLPHPTSTDANANLHRSQSHSGSSRAPYPVGPGVSAAPSASQSPHHLPSHAPSAISPLVPATRTPMFSPLGSPAGSPRARSAMLAGPGGVGLDLDGGLPSSAGTSPVLTHSHSGGGSQNHAAFYTPLNGAAASLVDHSHQQQHQSFADQPSRGRQDASPYGANSFGLDAYGVGGGAGFDGRGPSQGSRGRTGGRVQDLRGMPGSRPSAGSNGPSSSGSASSPAMPGSSSAGNGGTSLAPSAPGPQNLSLLGGGHLSPGAVGGLPYSSSNTSNSSRRAVSTPPPGSAFGVAPLYNDRLFAGGAFDNGAFVEGHPQSQQQQVGGMRPAVGSGGPLASGSTAASSMHPTPTGSGYTSPHHGLPSRPHLLSASTSSHSLSASGVQSAAGSPGLTGPPTNGGFAAALATSDLDDGAPSFLSPSLLLSPEQAKAKPLVPVTEPPLFALASGAHAGAVGDAPPSVFPRYPHPPGTRTRESSRSRDRTRDSSPLARDRLSPLKGSVLEEDGIHAAMSRLGLEDRQRRAAAAAAAATTASGNPNAAETGDNPH